MKTRKILVYCAGVLFLLAMVPLASHSEVPQRINYQGYLADSLGVAVPDGSYMMIFSIYDAAAGGTELWSESQTVTVANGVYNVQIGVSTGTNEFPENLFEGNRYLGVTVGSDSEMTPRQLLTCAPFAMRASMAEGVVDGGVTSIMIDDGAITGEKIATGEVTSSHIAAGAVGASEIENGSIYSTDVGFNYAASNSKGGPATDVACAGCVSPGELSFQAGDITAVLAGHGLTGGAYSGNATLSVQPPLSLSQGNWKYATISGTHTSDNVGVRGAYSNGNFGYLGSELYGVRGEHNNGNYGYLAGSSYGARGYHSSTSNYGYMGGASYGVYGRHAGSGNYGYLGSSTNGVRGYSTVESGRGVYGYATNTEAKGVYGYATYSGDEFVETYGGYFVAKGRRGHGIYAKVDYSGSGLKYAGYFECDSTTGYGVYAKVNGDYTNWAVRGEGTGSGSGGAYFSTTADSGTGIYVRGGANGWAGDFVGNVRIRNHSFVTVMELGEGLDYAEGFDLSEEAKIRPGDVLIIDPDNPGKLALSRMPYDTKVAGIAAGAKGLGSGVRLGGDHFDQDVALAGRVYCNVDATEAGVNPGDMLTTSSTPGYAKKSTDYMRAQGAILGKAMEGLKKGRKGQILVLVTLQ